MSNISRGCDRTSRFGSAVSARHVQVIALARTALALIRAGQNAAPNLDGLLQSLMISVGYFRAEENQTLLIWSHAGPLFAENS